YGKHIGRTLKIKEESIKLGPKREPSREPSASTTTSTKKRQAPLVELASTPEAKRAKQGGEERKNGVDVEVIARPSVPIIADTTTPGSGATPHNTTSRDGSTAASNEMHEMGSGADLKDPASKTTTVKASKKAKAGQAMNGKSLCKREWIVENSQGTEDEFTTYWTALGSTGQQSFNEKAKEKAKENSKKPQNMPKK
ncbi:hypothetical protein DXG01_013434, partial [Tephrocybe rancida]